MKNIKSIVIIFAITCAMSLNAQDDPSSDPGTLTPGGGAPPTEVKDEPDAIPLDGGLAILLLGAAAFGIKKLRGNKSDKS